MPTAIFFILVGSLVLGVVLIVAGRRGIRLNRHPVCRSCHFDLDGLYPATITCPECGAGLKRERAVRVGVRKRLWQLVAAGVVLSLLPIAPIGLVVYGVVTGTDLNKYKPVGLMLWEARRATPKNSAAIAAELDDRMVRKALSKDQDRRVAEAVLELQATPEFKWTEAWGNVFERATLNGSATPEQEKRFKVGMPVLEMKARKRAKAGGTLPIVIKVAEQRCAASSESAMMLTLARATMDGKEIKLPTRSREAIGAQGFPAALQVPEGEDEAIGVVYSGGSRSRFGQNMGWGEMVVGVAIDVPGDLQIGMHTLELEVDGTNADIQFMTMWPSKKKNVDQPSRRFRLPAVVEIIPADAEIVRGRAPTPELTEQLKSRLQPNSVVRTGAASIFVFTVSRAQVMVSFSLQDLPVDVAFTVRAEVGDKQWPLGELCNRSGTGNLGGWGGLNEHWLSAETKGMGKAKSVRLVFTPSKEVALRAPELSEYYDGEIVIDDVEFSPN
ncbi:MAG: hypothetical protein ACKVW3_01980 [Phycisphaerales bacterium]